MTTCIVCIQNVGDAEPTYLEGTCMISRSPVVHPGDGSLLFCLVGFNALTLTVRSSPTCQSRKAPEGYAMFICAHEKCCGVVFERFASAAEFCAPRLD